VNDALGDPQSVLVLGGTSEIAQAVTRRLVGRRVRRVVLAVRRPEAVTAFVAELAANGAAVEVVEFDADDTASHRAVLGSVFDKGDIDVTLLAFGVLGDQAAFDHDPQAAVAAVHTNMTGSVSCGLVVADRLRRQGHGALVVLSSVAGERVRSANFVYGATKAGLDGFAQGLGDSLVGTGARVLVVRPGFVRTKMTAGMREAPFTTDADAVADAVLVGLAKGRHTVWSPPALRYVFAVLRHLPRPLWRRMPG
jgi:decaprenylphospho-beta-D-erythro-pentofuranosid-2-ulose 2-reductase